MTSRTAQLARVYASLDAVPPIDRWNEPALVTTRCLPVDSDKITDMTLEEWRAEMALKYGEDGL
jgi:hypothetical protein